MGNPGPENQFPTHPRRRGQGSRGRDLPVGVPRGRRGLRAAGPPRGGQLVGEGRAGLAGEDSSGFEARARRCGPFPAGGPGHGPRGPAAILPASRLPRREGRCPGRKRRRGSCAAPKVSDCGPGRVSILCRAGDPGGGARQPSEPRDRS
jgi:hypothetical protein